MTITVSRRNEFWPVTMRYVQRLWCDKDGWHARIRLNDDFCMVWQFHQVTEIQLAEN